MSGCARDAGAGGTVGPLFSGLVFAQTALATTLVIGAGLLVHSYDHLRRVDPGFAADSVLVMDANLPQLVHPDFRDVGRMYEELIDMIGDVPGVAAVGGGSTVPLGEPLDFMASAILVGHPATDEPERAWIRNVTSGYLEALGVAIVQGRRIGLDDRMGELPVAVVNQTFVNRFLGGESALGQQVRFGTATDPTHPVLYRPSPEYEIVGVVGDARYTALGSPPEPTVYLAHHQAPTRRVMVTAKLSGRDAGSVSRDMREAFAKLDRTLPVEFFTMDDLVHASLATNRLAALILLVFGMSALGLAAVGIYGVIGLSVEQRIPEMAIRTAVGAAAGAVYLLCAVRGIFVAGAGIAVGIGGALMLRRLFETQLFEVTATDALVFFGAPGLLALVALVSISVPSARATRLDLAKTLRSQ